MFSLFYLLTVTDYLDVWDKPVIAVCNTSPTLVAAFELLVALCAGCIENLQYVANALTELYYSGKQSMNSKVNSDSQRRALKENNLIIFYFNFPWCEMSQIFIHFCIQEMKCLYWNGNTLLQLDHDL